MDSVEKFLAETDGNLNGDKTVMWGHSPDGTQCEVQFLNRGTSLEEYIRRASKANDAAPNRKREDLIPSPLKGVLTIGAFAPVLGAIVAPEYLLPSQMPFWFPLLAGVAVLSLATIGVLSLIGYLRRRANDSMVEELEEKLDRIRRDYCEHFEFEIDPDDIKERNGTSPIRAAMDRITPEARDSLAALIKAENEEAVESVLRTLIQEERDRLDHKGGMSADQIATITEDVLKQAR